MVSNASGVAAVVRLKYLKIKMTEDGDRWRHPDWNTTEGQKLRGQLERSERVRKEWKIIERKDARIAAIVVGAVALILTLPELLRFLHIEMPSWTYIPDWMRRYLF
jgi:hypothetical protein